MVDDPATETGANVIISDLVADSSVIDSESGLTAVRAFMVRNIEEGEPSFRGFAALQLEGIPKQGEKHPTIPDMFVTSRSTASLGPNTISVRVQYRGGTTLEFSASVQNTVTVFDAEGNTIKVSHREPQGDGFDAGVEQVKEVTKQTPMATVRVTRYDPNWSPQETLTMVGHLNREFFLGDNRGAWLCTAVSADTQSTSDTSRVTYEFQRGPDQVTDSTHALQPSWKVLAKYTDAKGVPIDDLEWGNGVGEVGSDESVRAYEVYPFNDSNITFESTLNGIEFISDEA